MTARLFILQPEPHPSRRNCAQAIGELPDGWRVKFEQPKKTRDQEEKYHAMFTDIARDVPVNGVTFDKESMKRILVSAFKIDTKDDDDLRECWKEVAELPMTVGLRGEIVIFGDQTRKFPKKLASAFIEWLYAFGAEHDVRWSEPAKPELRGTRARARAIEHGNVDADTGEITEVTA